MSSSFCTLTQWVRLHFSFEEARTWEGRQAGPGHRLFIGGLKPGSLTCNDPGLKNKSDREQKPQTRRKNALRPEFRLSSLRVPALPFQVDSHFCYCGISCHGLPRGTQVWRKKEVKNKGSPSVLGFRSSLFLCSNQNQKVSSAFLCPSPVHTSGFQAVLSSAGGRTHGKMCSNHHQFGGTWNPGSSPPHPTPGFTCWYLLFRDNK